MNLPEFSVKYPITIIMLMLGIILLGTISLDRLGTDLLPEIYSPKIVVELNSGERSPQEMEERFAKSLEGELITVSKVKRIQSISSIGRVQLIAEFAWGTDMDFALLDVQKKVSRYSGEKEVDQLFVSKYDPQAMPIMTLALRSKDQTDLDELRRLANTMVKLNLERLDGVAKAQIYGGDYKDVIVEVDNYLLEAYNLTLQNIIESIRSANIDAAGGTIVENEKSYIIKGKGKFNSLEDAEQVVIGYATRELKGEKSQNPDFAVQKIPIALMDVAKVTFTKSRPQNVVKLNGIPCVGLSVYKEAQDNTVKVVEQIHEELEHLRRDLPNTEFVIINDQAQFINQAIGEVKQTALIGIMLAIFILYVFLRNFGPTIIVSLAIPMSIIATFNFMYFNKLTFNIMTLGGLALGAGMLVDNAIIVIENIFRHQELGQSKQLAAVKGTSEVAIAITASTITTIVVFLPIIYVKGVAAELFKDQAWIVAFSLLASLVVAFLLIPMLAARLLKAPPGKEIPGGLRIRSSFYHSIQRYAMRHKLLVIAVTLLFLISSIFLLPIIGSEFVPKADQGQFDLQIQLPSGTSIEQTARIADEITNIIKTTAANDVQHIFQTSGNLEKQSLFGGYQESGSHISLLSVILTPSGKRQTGTAQLIQRIEPHLKQIPDLKFSFRLQNTALQQTIGTQEAPITVEVKGEDLHRIRTVCEEIQETFNSVPNLFNVKTSFEEGRPEINIELDRILAASFGLNIKSVSSSIKNHLSEQEVTDFYYQGDDRDIIIRQPQFDKSRIGKVTAGIVKGATFSKVMQNVQQKLNSIVPPENIQIQIAGEERERQESFGGLKFALILAIILVYMVLASLFESFLHPFTIMLTVPLAGIGVVLAFFIVQEPLSVMAYIGIIMLAGIAVNDSIVLVDYMNTLRKSGLSRGDAIIQAGQDRLRPILMTSATTILALFPLSLGWGEGAKLRAPMAIAVIGGLVASTILTLVVIPVIYDLIDRLRIREKAGKVS